MGTGFRYVVVGVLSALLVILVLAIVLAIPIAHRFTSTDIKTIDNDFNGIFSDASVEASSSDAQSPIAAKTIHILTVHGIGRHCIGYADGLVTGIARQAGLTYAQSVKQLFTEADCTRPITDYNKFENDQITLCDLIYDQKIDDQKLSDRNCQHLLLDVDVINSSGERVDTSAFYSGYIRTQDYLVPHGSEGSIKLRLYELTWDPATRWAKYFYVSDHDSEFDGDRELINKYLKRQVINESIADAVLYLGDYRPVMLYPILMAFCKMVSDSVLDDTPGTEKFVCDFDKIAKNLLGDEDFAENNEIVIVTHSLGTRMVFDALGIIANSGFVGNMREKLADLKIRFSDKGFAGVLEEKSQKIRDVFRQSTGKIFALANQIPLLELGTINNPTNFNLRPDLGERFAAFLRGRTDQARNIEPLQLVAFTDPNDLLSYNLKCWYYLNVLKHHKEIREKKKRDEGLYRKYFKRCTIPKDDPLLNEKTEKQQSFWKATDRYVDITDVTVSLSGAGFPFIFADPVSAHSKYFDDETIFQLIACGGKIGGQGPNKCPES